MLSSCLSLTSSASNNIRVHAQFRLVLFGRSKCVKFSMLLERKLSLKTPKIGKYKAQFSLSLWRIIAKYFFNSSNRYDAKNLVQYNTIYITHSKTVHTTWSNLSPSVSCSFVYNYQRLLCKVLYFFMNHNVNVILVICVFTKRV